jgi:hypothetical protein
VTVDATASFETPGRLPSSKPRFVGNPSHTGTPPDRRWLGFIFTILAYQIY